MSERDGTVQAAGSEALDRLRAEVEAMRQDVDRVVRVLGRQERRRRKRLARRMLFDAKVRRAGSKEKWPIVDKRNEGSRWVILTDDTDESYALFRQISAESQAVYLRGVIVGRDPSRIDAVSVALGRHNGAVFVKKSGEAWELRRAVNAGVPTTAPTHVSGLIYWRGSVSDLATDLRSTLGNDEAGELVRELLGRLGPFWEAALAPAMAALKRQVESLERQLRQDEGKAHNDSSLKVQEAKISELVVENERLLDENRRLREQTQRFSGPEGADGVVVGKGGTPADQAGKIKELTEYIADLQAQIDQLKSGPAGSLQQQVVDVGGLRTSTVSLAECILKRLVRMQVQDLVAQLQERLAVPDVPPDSNWDAAGLDATARGLCRGLARRAVYTRPARLKAGGVFGTEIAAAGVVVGGALVEAAAERYAARYRSTLLPIIARAFADGEMYGRGKRALLGDLDEAVREPSERGEGK